MTSKPRYTIQIDEEGYPLFEGFRVQDEELTGKLLSHLSRKERLILTECDGEVCNVESFDAPLVAQSVDEVGGTSAIWIFPGGVRHTVLYASMTVDPWNRFHTFIGSDLIPAVCSRKAQAALLNQGPTEHWMLHAFRPDNPNGLSKSVWNDRYQANTAEWDIGMVSPVLQASVASTKKYIPSAGKVLVPGAGRGHDAEFLSTLGYSVTALDFSPLAKEGFHKLYPKSKVQYLQADVFNYLEDHQESFDAIVEHTFFCAINPSLRTLYLKKAYSALKTNGFLLGVFFILNHEGGPPFGLTQWELRESLRERFEFLDWHISKDSKPIRLGVELWMIARKRT